MQAAVVARLGGTLGEAFDRACKIIQAADMASLLRAGTRKESCSDMKLVLSQVSEDGC